MLRYWAKCGTSPWAAGYDAVNYGGLILRAIKAAGADGWFPMHRDATAEAVAEARSLGLKVGARVVPGTVTKEIATQTLSFHITDGTVSYPVVFKGLPPDTFTDSVEVVVEGRLQRDGVIHATNVLAKCGSRYEAVPKA